MKAPSRARAVLGVVAAGFGLAFSSLSPAAGVSYPLPRVASANPENYTPHVLDGTVRTIAEVGSTVYVGGTFTRVRNASGTTTELPRRSIFAYNRDTGQVITTFNPTVDGVVESIVQAPNGSPNIIIGGRFRTVAGGAQRSLAMLTPAGTRVTTFTAATGGSVEKVLVRGNRLFASGTFTSASGGGRGATRRNLADFDATTGRLGDLNVPVTQGRVNNNGVTTAVSVQEMDANPAGTRLVIVGNFRQVGGTGPANLRQQIAMIDLTTNALAPWSTNRYPNDAPGTPMDFPCADSFNTIMRDVEFSPDGSYFAVVTTGAFWRNTLCDTVARWSTSGGLGSVESWHDCTGGDTLLSVAVTNAAIYVGGHQRWLNNCNTPRGNTAGPDAEPRNGIAALSPTGEVLPWNPGKERGVGAEELVATAKGLYVGSDTVLVAGERRPRLALFPAG